MRRRISLIAVVLAALLVAGIGAGTAAASIDNKGTEFLVAFLPNFDTANTVQLHLTGDVSTTVDVEYPAYAASPVFSTTATVTPGSVTIVTLPFQAAQSWTANAISSNLVRASSADEFIAYMVNVRNVSSDAALALPIDAMNTEYIVLDYNPLLKGAEFVVVAAFDSTSVTITPTTPMVGRPAGTPFTITLDQGEGYFGKGASTASTNTLTGTIISADRPVGLTNGNGATEVPTGVAFGDHIFEVAQPVQSWGTKIGVAGLPQRPNGTIYRILASEDTTAVTQDGAALVTLNRGDFFETPRLTGNHVFEGDKPIFVAQFMTGDTDLNAVDGDPAMGNMIPFAQYLSSYTFSTVGGSQFATNYVTIIAANADVGSLTLDGVAIPAGDYSAVPTTSFSATVQLLSQGTHSTASSSGHGITVEGFNQADSYIYPGGALFTFINPVGDANPPIVVLDPAAGDPPTINGDATDNRPSEDTNGNGVLDTGEDLNANGQIDEDTGIFFVELGPGSTNLTLTVTPFVPGDPSASFVIGLIDPNVDGSGTVVATDGAGNETSVPVLLTGAATNIEPEIVSMSLVGSTINENDTTTLTGTFTDSDNSDVHTLDIDWGDSSTQIVVLTVGDRSFSVPHQYLDDGSSPGNGTPSDIHTATVDLSDDNGGSDTGSADVEVLNVAPEFVPGSLSLTPVINENDFATLTGSFTDPGDLDAHTLVIDWDDGTVQTVTLPALDPVVRTFTVTHQYLDDGDSPGNGTSSDDLSVTLQLTDDDGGEAGTALGGNIFLTGHDPDFHAQGTGEPGADNLLRIALDFVTNGTFDDGNNPATKFLWVESRIAPPTSPFHRIGELGLSSPQALGLTLGVDYDRANAAELPAVNFEDYTAIAVASSFGGLLTRAELDALIARSADIRTFVNGGGGLFASSECDACGADLLGANPDPFGFVPVDVSSINASAPFFVQSFGTSLGLVNSDLQSPTHNSFADASGLQIVDLDTANKPTSLAGNVLIGDAGFSEGLPITVNNVAPVLTVPDVEAPFGFEVDLAGTFTDPGTLDVHEVTIDWGDGPLEVLVLPLGDRSFNASHKYEIPSNRVISVCVDDDDLGQSCDSVSITYVSTPGKITAGVLQLGNGGRGGFNVQSKDGESIKGELQYQDDSGKFHAHTMTDIAVSVDRTTAWFAGEFTNGSVFVAYVEDNGEPGKDSDVFKLWIDGALANGDGTLSKGNLQIHKKP